MRFPPLSVDERAMYEHLTSQRAPIADGTRVVGALLGMLEDAEARAEKFRAHLEGANKNRARLLAERRGLAARIRALPLEFVNDTRVGARMRERAARLAEGTDTVEVARCSHGFRVSVERGAGGCGAEAGAPAAVAEDSWQRAYEAAEEPHLSSTMSAIRSAVARRKRAEAKVAALEAEVERLRGALLEAADALDNLGLLCLRFNAQGAGHALRMQGIAAASSARDRARAAASGAPAGEP